MASLPAVDAWSATLLEAFRGGKRVLDLGGVELPLGPLGQALSTADADAFAQTVRGQKAGPLRGWPLAVGMVAGILGWSSGVIVAMVDHRQVEGRAALFMWLLVLAIACVTAVRRGFLCAPASLGVWALRAGLCLVGGLVLLAAFSAAFGAMVGTQALPWLVAIVGAATFTGTSLMRPRGGPRDPVVRAVRALVWTTLAFTSLFGLSTTVQSAMAAMHQHPDLGIVGADDD